MQFHYITDILMSDLGMALIVNSCNFSNLIFRIGSQTIEKRPSIMERREVGAQNKVSFITICFATNIF